ncbi:MAG TPA: thiolase family protein [Nocardioides sp.]|jgi:acetyl-CoA C-acetyltransferase|uniref:thiolase family protein n=1 Tax=Nocardioides sp. TaxID=35761 RepID=UPI002C0F91E7|nr:thiolase family protein [Nocardioides sp.]HTW17470.1 thiolase family protein [Nocardioides sp.]
MTDHPDDVLLVGGTRTPFSRFGGALREVPSVDIAAFAMRAAMEQAGIRPEDVDEVYSGVTIPSEESLEGSIPARVAMLRAGIPEDRLSLTIDRACCSSMTAAHLGTRAIRAGEADVVLIGGADNMGRAAFLMNPTIRWGIKRGGPKLKDPMAEPGADIGGKPVAVDAGEVAVEHGVTREEADEFALRSHQTYFEAKARGFYDGEITPITHDLGDLAEDEGPRADSSLERLARLRTIFDGPLVTPGNAPGQDTGGCYVVLARRRWVEERGLTPLARIAGLGSAARAPREIPVAPADAINRALGASGWDLDSIDGFEINEAFSCVPLVSARVLADGRTEVEKRVLDRLNVNGGAVAMGHPPGASGARILLTLARQLAAQGGGRGVASICGGLGQGDAAALEAVG